jgi:hypothetical protein
MRRPRSLLAPGLVLRASAGLALVIFVPSLAHADPPSLLDRAVVAAATRHAVGRAGLGPEVTQDLARRARAAGWAPHLTVRVLHGTGSSSTQGTLTTPDRGSIDDMLRLDVRVTFALDRVVFDNSEVAIARVELERTERRAALERDVIELLATLERTRAELRTLDPSSPEGTRAAVEHARARARLEALTGHSLADLIRGR